MLVVLLSVIGTTAGAEDPKPSGTVSIETKAVAEPFRWDRSVS
jgi:hypothetical protein